MAYPAYRRSIGSRVSSGRNRGDKPLAFCFSSPMALIVRALWVLSTLITLIQHGVAVSQDAPSPYGSGFAPDVIANIAQVNSLFIPETEGALITDPIVAINGTEAEGGDRFWGWAVDRRDVAVGEFYLRIMPLGASITQGIASTDGNGYRKHIRDQLRYVGWLVNMVGSKQDGSMADRVCIFFSLKQTTRSCMLRRNTRIMKGGQVT
jgi:hypothetical protein